MAGITEEQGTLIAAYPALRKWVDGFLLPSGRTGARPLTNDFP